ncbi:protein SEED AND ROOT HAIR PROTECTIVE PROTEIN [Ziziphus jujuba]|uniref:Protein SEED AND ROOT HAIR PROTECTIVE PROTEIN n=1 Tax=Ziziphus jujuba TaxID=326968 RepID=A0ABM3ZT00_ZIZJJ|nr:protein SEED AND ROOT HAIR PROTECTIVE PROTEIN [Ziziphus jujuba]
MASSSLYICTVLLLSLLVISSATDYGYTYTPTPQTKPEENYKTLPKPEEKDKFSPYKKPGDDSETKPYYGQEPNPEGKEKLVDLPNIFDVQGLVLCKKGSKYFPLKGAVARISCDGVDEEGYKRSDFYTFSGASDENGYFFATVCPSQLEKNWKLKKCKVFLDKEHSSLDADCNVPIDVNKAITGVPLASINYRILHDNINLYSVGPFFCTPSEPNPSVPYDGGY